MRILKSLWKLFQRGLILVLALLLGCNLYVLAVKYLAGEPHPTLFGWSWAVVLSGSMEPEISLDDLIVNRAMDSYRVGDIITFENGGSLTTHRIVAETESGFITRGDANNTQDRFPVTRDRILGKVVCTVPGVGLVLSFLKTPMGLLTLVLAGFALIEVPYLLEKRRDGPGKGCE